MTTCPCCSEKPFAQCCEPYLAGKQQPPTPEALMRSRYTAYTLANMAYIKKTMRGKALLGFDEAQARLWAKSVAWLKLEVCKTSKEQTNEAHVEFIAYFMENGQVHTLHENSRFLRKLGLWYYVDGVQKTR